jgi:hypothetical protein
MNNMDHIGYIKLTDTFVTSNNKQLDEKDCLQHWYCQ